ncbi:MAG: caspase family protein [Planctomycetota bacterium]|nr:caspase family protein [Planctomycetota bacterium]
MSTTAIQDSRIHVFAICDTTDDVLKNAPQIDLENIRSLFCGNVPRAQLKFHEIVGSDVTRSRVEERIREETRDVTEADTVVCYVSSHGAVRNGEHVILMKGGNEEIGRRDLRSFLGTRRKPRLTVILTDCCSLTMDEGVGAGFESPTAECEITRIPTALRTLFLLPTDLVDINSSTPPQASLCTTSIGSLFTAEFCSQVLDRLNQPLKWQELLDSLKRTVPVRVNDVIAKQTDAEPGSFGPPQQIDELSRVVEDDLFLMSQRMFLLLEQNYRSLQNGCVAIGDVYYDRNAPGLDSPSVKVVDPASGKELKLKAGDQGIAFLAGERITSIADFRRVVKTIPANGKTTLRVMGLATGGISGDYNVTLPWKQP